MTVKADKLPQLSEGWLEVGQSSLATLGGGTAGLHRIPGTPIGCIAMLDSHQRELAPTGVLRYG